MTLPIFQVDSFADQPFEGNPAAVCLLDGDRSDQWQQSLAAEMNLSETAFVRSEGSQLKLRWFTPSAEVDLCGHATLAAAHVLWETDRVAKSEPIVFESRSGALTATLIDNRIQLDFPASHIAEAELPNGLLTALGVDDSDFVSCQRTDFDLLVELNSPAAVLHAQPDFNSLAKINARGIIITSKGGGDFSDYDFVSRFFAPAVAVNEDPVTGSAHCALGPFWQQRSAQSDGSSQSEFVARQLSKRGGNIEVTVQGDRVLLRGKATTIFEGQLVCGRSGAGE